MKFSAFLSSVLPALLTVATILAATLVGGAATAQDNYRVRAGDTLRVEVIEDSSLNRTVLVTPDGNISLPLAGSVRASGRSVAEIQANLAAQLASNFAAPPSVFVSVERLFEPRIVAPSAAAPAAPAPTYDIFVMGEVASPGKIEVVPGTTILQLFAQMGGFSRFAATGRIQLRRTDAGGTEQVYLIDYDAILAGTSTLGSTTLAEGDVIVAPERRLFE